MVCVCVCVRVCVFTHPDVLFWFWRECRRDWGEAERAKTCGTVFEGQGSRVATRAMRSRDGTPAPHTSDRPARAEVGRGAHPWGGKLVV